MSDQKRQQLQESEDYQFYQLIFRRIPEEAFAVLYSEEGSPPAGGSTRWWWRTRCRCVRQF